MPMVKSLLGCIGANVWLRHVQTDHYSVHTHSIDLPISSRLKAKEKGRFQAKGEWEWEWVRELGSAWLVSTRDASDH